MSVLQDLEPRDVFGYFEEICQIPHGSGNTKAVSDYCVEFASRHLVHVIEDGSGAAKYEACQGHSDHSIDDMHPHFHCEGCGVTVCLDDTPVPLVSVPDGYEVYSVNYVIKGLCGVCASKYNS